MNRPTTIAVAVVALAAALTATSVAIANPAATHRLTDATGTQFDIVAPWVIEPITPTTTTTTTEPPAGLELPATIPTNRRGFKASESFDLILNCTQKFGDNCRGHAGIVTVPYLGHGLPYLYQNAVPGRHDHAWWVAGDRQGYACAYAFLYDRHPNPFGSLETPRPAELIARVAVVRPDGAAYGQIIDRYMAEGIRFLDGTPVRPSQGAEIKTEDCRDVADDFDYATYQSHGPDAIRVGLITGFGEVADIRDFTALDVADRAWFELVSVTETRATIVLMLEGLGVSHVFYYDTLGSGSLVVEVDGAPVS